LKIKVRKHQRTNFRISIKKIKITDLVDEKENLGQDVGTFTRVHRRFVECPGKGFYYK
jgi:dissimilatory sulfite reductase (desulfoviridin) alpha/beta subunit